MDPAQAVPYITLSRRLQAVADHLDDARAFLWKAIDDAPADFPGLKPLKALTSRYGDLHHDTLNLAWLARELTQTS